MKKCYYTLKSITATKKKLVHNNSRKYKVNPTAVGITKLQKYVHGPDLA